MDMAAKKKTTTKAKKETKKVTKREPSPSVLLKKLHQYQILTKHYKKRSK